MKTFAPVLIPTLNRYEHLKRCVESLSRCTHAEKTELIIGLDYPPSEKYEEGWKKICEYLPTITGFKKVTVLNREYNLGAVENINGLKKYANKSFDRYIFTEDDNVFSQNFLDFINKGLEVYKDTPNVFAICGYNYHFLNLNNYKFPYYFAPEMSAWGYGSWFNEKTNAVEKIVNSADYLTRIVREVPFSCFLKNQMRLCRLLFDIGLSHKGDAYYTYYEITHDMFCVFPKVSLVQNYGHDGTGIHCGQQQGVDVYSTQQIDTSMVFKSDFKVPVEYNGMIRNAFMGFQTGNKRKRYKSVLLLIIMKLFVKIRHY